MTQEPGLPPAAPSGVPGFPPPVGAPAASVGALAAPVAPASPAPGGVPGAAPAAAVPAEAPRTAGGTAPADAHPDGGAAGAWAAGNPAPPLDGGLGTAPSRPIAALPPLDELAPGPRLSEATGQPARPVLLVVALGCFYAAALAGAATLAADWWNAIHMSSFDHAARIIELLDPRPDAAYYAGTWQSILAAILMVAIGVVLVAAPWLEAFNAWEGRRWTRVFGLVSAAVCGLAWFMTTGRPSLQPLSHWLGWVPWLGVPLCLLGTALLWLPPVGRFFRDVRTVRTPPAPAPVPVSGITYGPLGRYRIQGGAA